MFEGRRGSQKLSGSQVVGWNQQRVSDRVLGTLAEQAEIRPGTLVP